MKKFMRRALRRHSNVDAAQDPSAAPPPAANRSSTAGTPIPPSPPPSPSRNRRRHIRLNFLQHRSPTDDLINRRNSLPHLTPRNSNPSPPTTPPSSQPPRAPVFYDMYENPPTLPPLPLHHPSAPPSAHQTHADHTHLTLSREQLQSALPSHYSTLSPATVSASSRHLRGRHNSFGPSSSRPDPVEYRRLHASQPLRHRVPDDLRRDIRPLVSHPSQSARQLRQDSRAENPHPQPHPQHLQHPSQPHPSSEGFRFAVDPDDVYSHVNLRGPHGDVDALPEDHEDPYYRHTDHFDDDDDSNDDDVDFQDDDGPNEIDVRHSLLSKTNSTTTHHDLAADHHSPFVRIAPRRSKTAIPDSVTNTNNRRRHDNNLPRANSSISYRPIEGSPFSKRPVSRQPEIVSAVDTKLYDAYTDVLHEEARGRAGGLRTIVNLLTDCEGNPIVIEKAAMAIGMLSESDAATRDVFGQYSAVQALLQSLSIRVPSKQSRAAIVEMVTFAMAALLENSPRNVRLFEMFDGPHKMGRAAASTLYENRPIIATHALKALAELKHHPIQTSDANAVPALSPPSAGSSTARTIRYVLRCLSVHEHRTDLQELGLDVLRTLIARCGHGALNEYLTRMCSQAAGTAFKLHSESREVQWQCLSLLCDLEDVQESMLSMELDVVCFFGALRMIIAEAKSATVGAEISRSLADLVQRAVDVAVRNGWRSQEFKDSAVEAGAVETVLDALDMYDGETKIVDKICTILRVLLQSEEGRYRMNSVSSACAILAGIETVNARAIVMQASS